MPKSRRPLRPETKAQITAGAVVATLVLGLVGFGKVQQARSPEALYEAIDRGDAAEVGRMLGLGANPNAELTGGMTPLDLAIVRGKGPIARMLLDHGATAKSAPGRTGPLHRAVMLNRVTIVESLLALGADPDGTDEQGMAPLLIAADRNATDVIEPLIAAGASLASTANQNGTALHLAAVRNNPRTIGLLAKHGAKVDATDLNGLTPLMMACITGSTEAGEALLELGANPNLVVRKSVADSPTAAMFLGTTPLIQNSRGSCTLLIPLLEAGADASATDEEGNTLLHAACLRWYSVEGMARLVELCRSVDARNKAGETPLHVAARGGNRFAMPALIAAGADVNARDHAGETPLHKLSRLLLPSTAFILLKAGADPKVRDAAGRTALDVALAQRDEGKPSPTGGFPTAGAGMPVAPGGHPTAAPPLQFRDSFEKRREEYIRLLESASARRKGYARSTTDP
ncbi:MAG: ankyrin repeat domain-containing protein [Fimbriimonadaceae bacterium]|nr:ankyrin repeat domain-containing protein [Fimbriimonadaceae bacterium]